MRKYIVIIGLMLTFQLLAQKNLVSVSSSPLTGIQLPAGSQQDKRILSTASASVLLETEAKAFGVKINSSEVLQLPAVKISNWNRNRFEETLREKGWQIVPIENRAGYGWLQRGNEYLFFYYAELAERTDLYFGRPDKVPLLHQESTIPSINEPIITQQPASHVSASEKPSLAGTWYKSSSTSNNVNYGYIKNQYHFKEDGTYQFYAKTFDVYNPRMVFRKEHGTYTFANNTLIIQPASTTIQTWSKKDNTDRWGAVIESQSESPVVTTYNLRFHSFGEKVNMLVSPVNKQATKREGPFGVNSEFPNTYFYEIPPDPSYLIELPDGEGKPATPALPTPAINNPAVQKPASSARNGGYTFSVTNWDDGWISTIEDDKVVVTKEVMRVHLYHPIAHNDASRQAGRDFYWDNYLAREFRILTKQYRDHGEVISAFQAPYVEGSAVDPKTGKNCFLAMYVTSSNGNMFPVVTVMPDETTHRKIFPNAENQFDSELPGLSRYNRFAVALPDLVGKWKGGGSAAMNYYNAYTGAYAGMGAVAMSDQFEFYENGDYMSKHQGASGIVGSMSTYSQEYKGRSVVTNWEITLPNRWQGKTSTFHAWFEVVRGGRVLYLQDVQYSGSRFSLVRE